MHPPLVVSSKMDDTTLLSPRSVPMVTQTCKGRGHVFMLKFPSGHGLNHDFSTTLDDFQTFSLPGHH